MSRRHPAFIRRFACLMAVLTAFFAVSLPVSAEETERPEIGSYPEENVLLMDADDPEGCVDNLAKNADERAYPASIVKLLTALVVLDRCALDEQVTVSAHAVDLAKANAKVGIAEGEVYTVEDLLYGALLPSGCDAARAVAEHAGGDESGFAGLMNQKAAALGMNASHFTNASGLHDPEQYSTARDLALLGAACAKNDALVKILTTTDYKMTEIQSGRTIKVRNINRLVRDPVKADYSKIECLYPYCVGGKTGSTIAAGLTFIAMSKREDKILVAVLLGDHREYKDLSGSAYDAVIAGRFSEARDLLAYGNSLFFPEYSVRELIEAGLPAVFSLSAGHEGSVFSLRAEVIPAEEKIALGKESFSAIDKTEVRLLSREIALPVEKGDILGTAEYLRNGEVFLSLALVAAETVTEVPETAETPEASIAAEPAVPTPGPSADVTAAPSPVPAAKPAGSPIKRVIYALCGLLLLLLLLGMILLKKARIRR